MTQGFRQRKAVRSNCFVTQIKFRPDVYAKTEDLSGCFL